MDDITPSPTVKKLIPFPEDMAPRIADFRFAARLPSECEAVRRLVAIGLAAATQPQEVAK